jgi:hypothetical protein
MKILLPKSINILAYTLIVSLTACMGSEEKAPSELPGIWLSSFGDGDSYREVLLVIDEDRNFRASLCYFGEFPETSWIGRLDEAGSATVKIHGNTVNYTYVYSNGQLQESFISRTETGELVTEYEGVYQPAYAIPDACHLQPEEMEITQFETQIFDDGSMHINFNYRYTKSSQENLYLKSNMRNMNGVLAYSVILERSPDTTGNIVEGFASFATDTLDFTEGDLFLVFGFGQSEDGSIQGGVGRTISASQPPE